MNYRHIYHAGNVCDVVKHAVLCLLLEHMRAKDKPFAVLDTHAGCGIYDLADERALKTSEAEDGIRKIWDLAKSGTACLATYLNIVAQMNAGAQTLRY